MLEGITCIAGMMYYPVPTTGGHTAQEKLRIEDSPPGES